MEFQTVIWHKPTGKIVKVLSSRYIGRRSDLHTLAPEHPLQELRFFYDASGIEISQLEDHVKQLVNGQPPAVISPSGLHKSFASFADHRRKQVSAAANILCHFEGGMGDQILQAEAVRQFYEIFPEKRLTITVSRSYYEVVKNIQGLIHVFPRDAQHPTLHPDFVVDMHTQYISDPRGGLFGKASLYGASLGLKSVHQDLQLRIPPAALPIADPSGVREALKQPRPKIGFHIRSGSGHGKSWNTEPAESLARRFIKSDNALVFLFGNNSDWQMRDPSAFRVDQHFPWLQSAAVISKLDLLYCIDSGPMHLARALGTLHIILWGGTSYRDILGREVLPHDVRLELPCIDQICSDCPKGVPLCMNGHDPDFLYLKGKAYAKDKFFQAALSDRVFDHQEARPSL